MIKKVFIIPLILCLFGCSATSDFSTRKYLPGHFKDKIESYSVVPTDDPAIHTEIPANTPRRRSEKREKNSGIHKDTVTNAPAVPVSLTNEKENKCENNEYSSPAGAIDSKHIISTTRSDEEIQKRADRAFLHGMLCLVFYFSGFLFFLAIPYGISAAINANEVLNHPRSTPEQKKKARQGKIFANIAAVLFLIPIILILLLLYWGVI